MEEVAVLRIVAAPPLDEELADDEVVLAGGVRLRARRMAALRARIAARRRPPQSPFRACIAMKFGLFQTDSVCGFSMDF